MEQTAKKQYTLLICLALTAITFISFQQVRHNDFINLDDATYVADNPNIQKPLTIESIIWSFGTDYTHESANWHPLTWLSHIADYQLYGLNPAGHHMTNLLLHIINTLLLFWVLNKMTGSLWPSAFVAALFAVHPLGVESVAWIAERKDVLSGLFAMLTMLAYANYVKAPKAGKYLLVVLAFALGLMAKPMLVTLPFVLLLLDYWPLNRLHLYRGQRKTLYPLITEKIPLFILSAASCVVTFIVQQKAGALKTAATINFADRMANAAVGFISYIAKTIYPARLAILYPHPYSTLPIWKIIISCIILLAVTAAVICYARRNRFAAVGWFWYLGTLIPVIGIIQVGTQATADRYTYLPSIGLFIIVSFGLEKLFASSRPGKLLLSASGAIVIVVLMICTVAQVRRWKNTDTLFAHTLKVTENNFVIHNNYGQYFLEKKQFKNALIHFATAVKINPTAVPPRENMAKAYVKQGKEFFDAGKMEKTIICYRRALKNGFKYPAQVYNDLGAAYLLTSQFDQAAECLDKAIELKPEYAQAINNMGMVLYRQGQPEKALQKWEQVLQIEPDNPEAHFNIAKDKYLHGQYDLAATGFKQALIEKPNWPVVHNYLGNIYYIQKNFTKAVANWKKALTFKPEDFIETINNLAWLLAAFESEDFYNPHQALELAQTACELTEYKRPGFLDTLAIAFAANGDFTTAIETAQKAIDVAKEKKEDALADKIAARLVLYKREKPYRENTAD